MRLQRETDYALRCVLCLALHGEPVSGDELVKLTAAPVSMLKKVITKLNVHGIVETKRGPGGGIWLARPPRSISVYDVIRSIEGELSLNMCLTANAICSRNGLPACGVHRYLAALQSEIKASMRAMTFDKIMAQNGRPAKGPAVFAAHALYEGLAAGFPAAGSKARPAQGKYGPMPAKRDVESANKADLI